MTVFAEDLVISKRRFLDLFNRRQYDEAYKTYSVECAPVFNAIESAGSELEDSERMDFFLAADDFVSDLIAEWETSVKGKRRRQLRMLNDRTLITVFLVPAALDYGEHCTLFAQALAEVWGRRFPKEKFYVGSYAAISEGFKPRLKWLDFR